MKTSKAEIKDRVQKRHIPKVKMKVERSGTVIYYDPIKDQGRIRCDSEDLSNYHKRHNFHQSLCEGYNSDNPSKSFVDFKKGDRVTFIYWESADKNYGVNCVKKMGESKENKLNKIDEMARSISADIESMGCEYQDEDSDLDLDVDAHYDLSSAFDELRELTHRYKTDDQVLNSICKELKNVKTLIKSIRVDYQLNGLDLSLISSIENDVSKIESLLIQ